VKQENATNLAKLEEQVLRFARELTELRAEKQRLTCKPGTHDACAMKSSHIHEWIYCPWCGGPYG